MPKILLVVLAFVSGFACVASAVGLAHQDRTDGSPSRDAAPVAVPVRTSDALPPAPELRAAEMLASWDRARADAWAAGDVLRLAELYTPGSAAGRRDRAMLRAWTARGLVVRGLRTQLLAVEEVRRSPTRWVLRVTDRVVSGTAVGRGARRVLPRDGATTATLTLRQMAGAWRMEAVRPG